MHCQRFASGPMILLRERERRVQPVLLLGRHRQHHDLRLEPLLRHRAPRRFRGALELAHGQAHRRLGPRALIVADGERQDRERLPLRHRAGCHRHA
jgi:hypothetical protein